MLLNKNNQIVHPTAKELKKNPSAYREVLQPSQPSFGNLFEIEQRARVTGGA